MKIDGFSLGSFYAGIVTYTATNESTGEVFHAWCYSDLARIIGATIDEVKAAYEK